MLIRRGTLFASVPSVTRLIRYAFRRFPFATNCAALGVMYTMAEFSQQTINNAFVEKLRTKTEKLPPREIAHHANVGVLQSFIEKYDFASIKK